MGSLLLFCTRCWTGYASIGEIPTRCPACDRITRWATSLPPPVSTVPYVITENDARLLKSLRIDPERPLDGRRGEE